MDNKLQDQFSSQLSLSSLNSQNLQRENSSKSNSNLNECRICFLTQNQEDILQNPCECKGSMSYVHQACLIRWLTQQNIRICELCKKPFTFQEKFIGMKGFLTKNFRYLFSDKKRLIKLGIYLIYLYLFGKRMIILFQYFKNYLVKYIFVAFKSKQSQNATIYQNSRLLDYNLLSRLEKLKLFIIRVLKILKFFYSVFIGVQLVYLGKNESHRIKKLIEFMINNAKEIKIQGGKALKSIEEQ
eukprot:403337262